MAFGKTPRPLADVAIRTPDLKKINPKQYRGKEVVVVLFSTTCDGCVKTITLFDKLQKDFGPRGLQVLGAAVNPNAQYLIEPFKQRYRPSFPVGYLDEEATMKLADFDRDTHPFVPIVIFVDRQGTVRVQYFGNDPVFKDQEKAFRAVTDSLLKFNPNASATKK
jgi:peroxiredoxin